MISSLGNSNENNEINNANNEESIQSQSEKVSNTETKIEFNFEDLKNNQEFFQQNISNILEFIQHFDVETVNEPLQFILNFITETIKNHPNEHETIFLLEYIKIPSTFLLTDDISILKLFTHSPICQHISLQYENENKMLEIDYEYLLNEKDKEITQLKQQIDELSHSSSKVNSIDQTYYIPNGNENKKKANNHNPNMKKPFLFENDIFKAIEKGKLSSVQYHIEFLDVDVNTKNSDGETLTSISKSLGKTDIYNYLISKGGSEENCPKNLKIALIGHPCTGKTHFISKVGDSPYEPLYFSTTSKTLDTKLGQIKLQFDEMPGQDDFRGFLYQIIEPSNIILLFFSFIIERII